MLGARLTRRSMWNISGGAPASSPTYRDSVPYLVSSSSITIDPSTLTYQANDLLFLVAWGYTSLGAPSGSDVTWTQRLTDTQAGPFGNTDICTIWTATADSSLVSFTIAHGVSDQIGAVLLSIAGADTANPIDASAITSNVFSTVGDPTAPSITTITANTLLVCTAGVWPQSGGTSSFTAPAGMTKREDMEDWDSYCLATQELTASGSTGAKVFAESPSLSDNSAWIAATVAIKAAA